eukprot:253225-Prymnesium_polylepis.1
MASCAASRSGRTARTWPRRRLFVVGPDKGLDDRVDEAALLPFRVQCDLQLHLQMDDHELQQTGRLDGSRCCCGRPATEEELDDGRLRADDGDGGASHVGYLHVVHDDTRKAILCNRCARQLLVVGAHKRIDDGLGKGALLPFRVESDLECHHAGADREFEWGRLAHRERKHSHTSSDGACTRFTT